jgi:hypothetical protein
LPSTTTKPSHHPPKWKCLPLNCRSPPFLSPSWRVDCYVFFPEKTATAMPLGHISCAQVGRSAPTCFNASDIAGDCRRRWWCRVDLRVVMGRCFGCQTWFWWLRGLEMSQMSWIILMN